jgi:hypothetical protein
MTQQSIAPSIDGGSCKGFVLQMHYFLGGATPFNPHPLSWRTVPVPTDHDSGTLSDVTARTL